MHRFESANKSINDRLGLRLHNRLEGEVDQLPSLSSSSSFFLELLLSELVGQSARVSELA